MEHEVDNSRSVVAALAAIYGGGDAASIVEYMPEAEGARITPLIELYCGGRDGGTRARNLLAQALASEKFSSISEIHPAWILERLALETPRVIGIILRALPSKHVRYILKNMSPMQKAKIPHMVESFAVPAPVLDVIRRRFEKHFLPMRISRAAGRLGFEHLYYLKGEELEELIRDLGLTELAIALSGLRGKTLHAVYNRLDLKDARRLNRRIKELKDVSPELLRQARYAVLEVEGAHLGPDRMLTRIGLAALASAFGKGCARLVSLIQQRLGLAEGYLLKRLADERISRSGPALVAERQHLILEIVALLAEDGRIDPTWRKFLPEDIAPIALDPPAPITPSDDEETATNPQQLA